MKNIRIGIKLIAGFVVVALIVSIVGTLGYMSLAVIGGVRMPSFKGISMIEESAMRVWVRERGFINRRMMTLELRNAQYTFIETAYQSIQLHDEIARRRQSDKFHLRVATAAAFLIKIGRTE